MINQRPPSAGRPDRYPQDDPFLELLFGTMCQSVAALPGETFVDRAQRWIDALRFTVALKPRNQQEWLLAADVTTKQFCAVYSLVMQRHDSTPARQRLRHGQDYLIQLKAIREARVRYDAMRRSRAD